MSQARGIQGWNGNGEPRPIFACVAGDRGRARRDQPRTPALPKSLLGASLACAVSPNPSINGRHVPGPWPSEVNLGRDVRDLRRGLAPRNLASAHNHLCISRVQMNECRTATLDPYFVVRSVGYCDAVTAGAGYEKATISTDSCIGRRLFRALAWSSGDDPRPLHRWETVLAVSRRPLGSWRFCV